MVAIGYTMMSEQTPPRQLVRDLRTAEDAGFDFSVMSDHHAPWLEEQGHSPYAWSVLGAAAQATERIPLMTFVTCPTMRYHPAVVAQKAATMDLLSGGRFTLGIGAGENLNEHVAIDAWPPVGRRHEMLVEAVEIIRELLAGGYVTYEGDHFSVESARIWDLPEDGVPIGIAASGPESGRIAAENGDALIAISPDSGLVRGFNEAGGAGKPVYGQIAVSYDTDVDAARERAHRLWRWSVAGWKVMAELPSPVNFGAQTATVRPDDVAELVPCGPDVEPVVAAVRKFAEAGFTHLALVGVGAEKQDEFLAWSNKELLPALRELGPAGGGGA